MFVIRTTITHYFNFIFILHHLREQQQQRIQLLSNLLGNEIYICMYIHIYVSMFVCLYICYFSFDSCHAFEKARMFVCTYILLCISIPSIHPPLYSLPCMHAHNPRLPTHAHAPCLLCCALLCTAAFVMLCRWWIYYLLLRITSCCWYLFLLSIFVITLLSDWKFLFFLFFFLLLITRALRFYSQFIYFSAGRMTPR